jgi:excisionase family DNA binding protein
MSTSRRPPRPSEATAITSSYPTEVSPTSGSLLYTADEAAALLQIRPSWLRKQAAARQIPCTFLGRHLRFSPADLAAIIAAHTRPAAGHTPRRPTRPRRDDLPPGPSGASIGTPDDHQ